MSDAWRDITCTNDVCGHKRHDHRGDRDRCAVFGCECTTFSGLGPIPEPAPVVVGGLPPASRTVHRGIWRPYPNRENSAIGYPRCDYCGSLTPAEALRRMTTPGCSFSCTDKGAYKFYLESEPNDPHGENNASEGRDHGKFYGEHLADLTFEELEVWSAASRRCLGYDFLWQGLGVQPKVKRYSTGQCYGVVGSDGMPVFKEHSGRPASEEEWAAIPRDLMREVLKT